MDAAQAIKLGNVTVDKHVHSRCICHLFDIRPSGKSLVIASDDNGAHSWIGIEALQGIVQLTQQGAVECIPHLGTVDTHKTNPLVDLDQNGFISSGHMPSQVEKTG